MKNIIIFAFYILLALGMGSCTSATLGDTSHASLIPPSSEADIKAALLELKTRNTEGTSRCSRSGDHLVYVGGTDLNLISCLLNQGDAATVLSITSTGGPVEFGIWAARIVSARSMVVHVRGYCASSCANYILPAASTIWVDRLSTISVHGGPKRTASSDLEAMLETSGLSAGTPEFTSALTSNMQRLNASVDLHDWYRSNFEVSSGYYELDDIRAASTDALIIVDPDHLEGCLGRSQVRILTNGEFDKPALIELYQNKSINIVFFEDVRTNRECE